MAKKKINRKKNKGLCKVNYFGNGGLTLGNVFEGIGTAAAVGNTLNNILGPSLNEEKINEIEQFDSEIYKSNIICINYT